MASTSTVSAPVPIAVHGASGRMGQAVLRLAAADPAFSVAAALVRAGSPMLGTRVADAPGLAYCSELAGDAAASVLLDVSNARAFDAALALARDRAIAFVSGTTGLDARQQAAMEEASASIAVLWAANFSLGVALLRRLVAQAAAALPEWDCEIVEVHHARKLDAPSGTALDLGRAVAAARGRELADVAASGRAGAAALREPGSIGFASLRAGDIVGEHTVMFAGPGERVEVVHRAADRDVFARGALAAVRWMARRGAGLYRLEEVLAGD